jgi:Tfp pilus assembly protein FimT
MNRHLRTRQRQGFTLADLMITVLILGILSAVTAPKMMNTMGRLQVEAAAKHVAADLRYARQLAKVHGTNQSVTFTPASNS